ncbi:MAG: arginine--tRNA ligase [Phototrophicales bacterium]|nr:MAG: arginine--tRNA ligase [Phototrophicales bacterium]
MRYILKPLTRQIASLVHEAIQNAQQTGELPPVEIPDIEVKPPRKAEQGDYGASVALAMAKSVGKPPLEVANIIAKHMNKPDFISAIEVAPPGFINVRFSEDWIRSLVTILITSGETFGKLDIGTGKRAQVEFLSANPTGPITIGRSRGAILGDAIARVLEETGYDVEREYYFNNAGAQMRNLGESLRIRYLQALGQQVDIPDIEKFYQGEYLIDYAKELIAEKGDALKDADWQPFKEYAEKRMFEWIKETCQRIGIHHDVFFNENTLYDTGAVWKVLEKLQERGYIYAAVTREGETDAEIIAKSADLKPAQWFRSTQFGDDEDRVLVKSNGEPTYTLPDIAYHVNKIERGFDLLVNILGADHFTQAQVVRMGVQALGYDPKPIRVVHVQMVSVVRDGKPFKGSTRRGIFDTLDELIDLTSADAIRYFLLHRSPDSHLKFDINVAVSQSNDNPVYYIQYAHVRCSGILREAGARGVTIDGADLSLLGTDELNFLRKCLEFLDVMQTASENLTPHTIAFYALELANAFHPMYDRVRAFADGIDPNLQKARLAFYTATKAMFKRVLTVLGMTTPERM